VSVSERIVFDQQPHVNMNALLVHLQAAILKTVKILRLY